MFCKSCGAEMEDGCKRCTQCGNDPNIDYGHDIKRESNTQYDNSYSYNTSYRPTKRKSKVIAGILQIIFPGFAAGRWYLGSYGIAIAQMVVSCLFAVRMPFTLRYISIGALWAIYDGICILCGKVKTDAYGNELR